MISEFLNLMFNLLLFPYFLEPPADILPSRILPGKVNTAIRSLIGNLFRYNSVRSAYKTCRVL
jgi:hypothetical protein